MATTHTLPKQESSQITFKLAQLGIDTTKISIIDGTEEEIFGDIYVSGIIRNNRVVKFKKEALVFL